LGGIFWQHAESQIGGSEKGIRTMAIQGRRQCES
jgi:hypothetical protein